MVTCTKCGAQVKGDAVFCVKCGTLLKPMSPPAGAIYCGKCGQQLPHIEGFASGSSSDATASELAIPQQYVAPMCYLFGWVSGLALFFMDKRPTVRFHAAQSTIVFGILNIGGFIAGRISRNAFVPDGQQSVAMAAFACFAVIVLISLVLWILLMVKAFERKPFRIPIVAQISERLAGKPRAK